MKLKRLGRTNIEVSQMCIGSMEWGSRIDSEVAHKLLDRAFEHGVNFIDTAEMYPVNPIRKDTKGRTERIIGLWLDDRSRRDDVVIATKHTGDGIQHVRDGAPIDANSIPQAIEGSLRRLKTDYIDLYQFHWPNRGSYMFRKNWSYDPSGYNRDAIIQNMEDCIGALQREADKGRIRAFGLSNESAWGITQWIDTADRIGGMRAASVQNEYSLLCRIFDTDLSEVAVLEDVGLLAFSPLANGLLTGKYRDGAEPEGSRMASVPGLGGRATARAFRAVEIYTKIAERHGLKPGQMALAWCLTRPFMTSVIFGASNYTQLEEIMGAVDLVLGEDVIAEIDKAHREHPMPY